MSCNVFGKGGEVDVSSGRGAVEVALESGSMVEVGKGAVEAGHLANEDLVLCRVFFVKVCSRDVEVSNGPVFGGGDGED